MHTFTPRLRKDDKTTQSRNKSFVLQNRINNIKKMLRNQLIDNWIRAAKETNKLCAVILFLMRRTLLNCLCVKIVLNRFHYYFKSLV